MSDDKKKKIQELLRAAMGNVQKPPETPPNQTTPPTPVRPISKTGPKSELEAARDTDVTDNGDEKPVDPLGQTSLSDVRKIREIHGSSADEEEIASDLPSPDSILKDLREQQAEADDVPKDESEKPDSPGGWGSGGKGGGSGTFPGKKTSESKPDELTMDEFMQFYNDAFNALREGLKQLDDFLSEREVKELEILCVVRQSGKIDVEVISKNEDLRRFVGEHLRAKVGLAKIDKPPEEVQRYRHIHDGIPPFVATDDIVVNKINELITNKRHQLDAMGVDKVTIRIAFKRARNIEIESIDPEKAGGILVDELLKILRKYKNADRGNIKFPKSADSVTWEYTRRIVATRITAPGIKSASPPSESTPEQDTSPEPAPAPTAEPIPLDKPVKRPAPAPVQQPSPEPTPQPAPQDPIPKTEDPTEDSQVRRVGPYEVRFREQVKTIARYTVKKIDPATGQEQEIDTIEFETTGKGPRKKVITDKIQQLAVQVEVQDGKPVITDINVTEQEPKEQEPLTFWTQWEAAAGAAALTGTIVGLLPHSVQWIASKVPFLSTIKVPEQVYSIPSSYIVAAVASVVAIGSGLIIWRDKSKKKKQVKSNER